MGLLARLRDKWTRTFVYPRLVRAAPRMTQEALAHARPGRVLVLCHGNIYRSPFVARLLEQRLGKGSVIVVSSAGFHPRPDRPSPSAHVAMVERRYGLDLSGHRSAVVQAKQLRDADMIVIMEPRQLVDIHHVQPDAEPRVVWLGAVGADTPTVIADPYGRPEAEAEVILDQLYRATEALAQRVLTGAGTASAGSRATTV